MRGAGTEQVGFSGDERLDCTGVSLDLVHDFSDVSSTVNSIRGSAGNGKRTVLQAVIRYLKQWICGKAQDDVRMGLEPRTGDEYRRWNPLAL